MKALHSTAALLGALLLPLAAQAHPGHEAHATLLQGLLHPLTGWDHLCVLLSLGVLAAGRGLRIAATCGAVLILALAGGATLGLRFPALPFVEPAIMATVLACVALLYFRRHIHGASLLSLCLAFMFIHGMAHGQEAPAGDPAGYFSGFTLSGVAIYGMGLAAARALRAWPLPHRGRI